MPGPPRIAAPAVRCAVVVDSRNIFGQTRRRFGIGSHVTFGGVTDALARIGFEVVQGFVGIATLPAAKSPSQNLAGMCDRNRLQKARFEAEGFTVMEGLLAERNNQIEEKQVDVLCAVKVAELAVAATSRDSGLEAVVVISEDMDLMPAFDYATRLGVPVYAASVDTVHRRPSQADWLLLSDQTLALMQGLPESRADSLRAKVASIALEGRTQSLRWTGYGVSRPGRPTVMKSNTGLLGYWNPTRPVQRNRKYDLHPVSLTVSSDGFPFLNLSDTEESGGFEDVVLATAKYWVEPTRLAVQVDGDATSISLTVPPGAVLPGERLAVLRTTMSNSPGHYFVGPAHRGSVGRPPGLVVVDGVSGRSGWHPGRCVPGGAPHRIHARTAPAVRVGDVLLAAEVEAPVVGQPTGVMPLSTAIRGARSS